MNLLPIFPCLSIAVTARYSAAATYAATSQIARVAIADLNGDGIPDMVTTIRTKPYWTFSGGEATARSAVLQSSRSPPAV